MMPPVTSASSMTIARELSKRQRKKLTVTGTLFWNANITPPAVKSMAKIVKSCMTNSFHPR